VLFAISYAGSLQSTLEDEIPCHRFTAIGLAENDLFIEQSDVFDLHHGPHRSINWLPDMLSKR
jgi:hypothetical protein